MTNKITATFVNRLFQDSGRDQAPDYYIYAFTNIVDSEGNNYSEKWIKETELMKSITFQIGKQYEITLSKNLQQSDSINLPYPIEISLGNEKVYIKSGNSIIRVDKNKKEENLSEPLNKVLGISNYEKAALNKFGKGNMTEELLLKMNSKGVFYTIHNHYNPRSKTKIGICKYGSTKKEKENLISIQKETQAEIDRDLEVIKQSYVNHSIEKHFIIKAELLPPIQKMK